MRVLGITMAAPLIYEHDKVAETYGFGHDSAAVLIIDNKIVTAIEEERLNRLKHSNKAPVLAMRKCLTDNHLTIEQIDAVAVNFTEEYLDLILSQIYMTEKECNHKYSAREYVHRAIYHAFEQNINDEKIYFVPHHKSHGMSSYFCSGFQDCILNVVIDGLGDGISGIISSIEGEKETILKTIPYNSSLGRYYLEVIRYLGYEMFDEYKVMGLAPYGDKIKYKKYFDSMYCLLPNGEFEIYFEKIYLLQQLGATRRKGEPFTQIHKDIAAALQYSLEEIVLHFLKYYQKVTGHKNLCLSGGVAHNCSLNGKIYYSGIFKKIFVQPAAYDSGTAIGAAMSIIKERNKNICFKKMKHVYYGTNIEKNDTIIEQLKKWSSIIEIKKMDEPISEVVCLLTEQKVIGWVQGSSEFGPRALGNRSILADPRPSSNKDKINRMVKKREQYRPFAPSVLKEYLETYFEITDVEVDFSYMNFVVNVLEDKRNLLGAITHIDGTARIQTVTQDVNPVYWNLIYEFGKRTGVFMLLNTSFNNNVEPIVDSVDDAITTFLTTKLDYLIIKNYLICRKSLSIIQIINSLNVKVPEYTQFIQRLSQYNGKIIEEYFVRKMNSLDKTYKIGKELFDFIRESMLTTGVNQIYDEVQLEVLVNEIYSLWEKRYIFLKPKV